MLRGAFSRALSRNPASSCHGRRTPTTARTGSRGAHAGCSARAVEENVSREWALLGERVGAQALRKRDERRNAARFGTPAPVLQLTQQLLFRRTRAIPERSELVTHGKRDLQRAGFLERFGHLVRLGACERLATQERT